MTPDGETLVGHFNTCDCHDSWDQCPCADSGHPADGSCDCCPLGTGICGPRPTAGPASIGVDAPVEVVQRFLTGQGPALGFPGFKADAVVRASMDGSWMLDSVARS